MEFINTPPLDVRGFIRHSYTPYTGDDSFLAPPTERTLKLWEEVKTLLEKERSSPGGMLEADGERISTITAYGPGYIDRDLEVIVGLQTDRPLKRAIMPNGGVRMVEQALKEHGCELSEKVKEIYKYRRCHNESVFDVYTPDIRAARTQHLLTGLPDAYGRGRIIGDYRRVALYGADRLLEEKDKELRRLDRADMTENIVRRREETAQQKEALRELIELGESYGFDLRRPAKNTKEAVQWLYMGYLAAVKQQNGAAMSLGRVSTFLDVYAERDLKSGACTEGEIQEIVDQFVMKLRMVRFLRTKEYDAVFAGDPVWVTESIGGMCEDGRPLVTKMSFRFLHTLTNLGPAPEPNMTVLWSRNLPENFKSYAARMSIASSAIQYENDDLMRPELGDDYGIACCVSPMRIGKQMQFFGARANLAKCLLYAINGGVDEITGVQTAPVFAPCAGEELDFREVMEKFDAMMTYLAQVYTKALYMIHYMHDKYNYESLEMALMDGDMKRTTACGIAGLSVAADSLSAIKYARVRPVRDERGIAVDFRVEGDFPKYGNNDDRADAIVVDITRRFMEKLRRCAMYRGSRATQSVLTITSNVEYGKYTGATPDGRRQGEPLAPGANPMHGRDVNGALASLLSVAKIPFDDCEDGISYTFSMSPGALGKTEEERARNLVTVLDAYFHATGQHLNVNVLNRDTLLDAMDHPEKYPQLTIRVSGYAVNFIKLSREQQLDVISRTFHEKF